MLYFFDEFRLRGLVRTAAFFILATLMLPVGGVALAARGSETSIEEIVGYQQRDIQAAVESELFGNSGKTLGISFKPLVKLAPMVKKSFVKNGIPNTNYGIPFSISATAASSTVFPEMEELGISCRIIFDAPDILKKSQLMSYIKGFDEQFQDAADIAAGRAEAHKISRKFYQSNGCAAALEITSRKTELNKEPPPLIFQTPSDAGGGLMLGGVDIAGDGAVVSGRDAEKSTSTAAATAYSSIFAPELKVLFVAGDEFKQMQVECLARFRMKNEDTPEFIKRQVAALEDFAGLLVDNAVKAANRSGIIQKPAISKTDSGSDLNNTASSTIQPDITGRDARIAAIQARLEKLVPDYIPDNPARSDDETVELIEELLEGKTTAEIRQEAKELEENTLTTSDGSGLEIIRITPPADETVGPGESFQLELKIVNHSSLKTAAAFTLYAVDSWSGKVLGKSVQRVGPGESSVVFSLRAPPAGEAAKRHDFAVVLEPMIGRGPEAKQVKMVLRGSQSDGDVLNVIRRAIFSVCSDTTFEGERLSEADAENVCGQWQKKFWAPEPERKRILDLFKSDSVSVLDNAEFFARQAALKIAAARADERRLKTEAEAQQMEKTARLISYFRLETAAYKRNSLLDFRKDPGYNLLDVLADNVVYDEKTGEVIGDLDSARAAVTEAHWQLAQETMSAAEKYYLAAGDDGLPQGSDVKTPDFVEDISVNVKTLSESFKKLSEVVETIRAGVDGNTMDIRMAEQLAAAFKKAARLVRNKAEFAGDAAKPLADALAEYEGIFTKVAGVKGLRNGQLGLSDLPATLAALAGSIKNIGARVNSALETYENALRALPETGRFARSIKVIRGSIAALRKMLAAGLDIGGKMATGLVRFADGLLETAARGTGKTAGQFLESGVDGIRAIDGNTGQVADKFAEMLKGGSEKIGAWAENNKGSLKRAGNYLDLFGVLSDADAYSRAGYSQTESYARALVSGGIEKIASDRLSPLGLINYGMVFAGEKAAKNQAVNDFMQKKLGMSPKQVNFSTPVRIISNTGVNYLKDFFDEAVEPGKRIKMARENSARIAELVILENRCLEMARSAKDAEVKQQYIEKRRLFREEIRRLGGRTE